jgi:predicted phage terminase large subunit-like protein
MLHLDTSHTREDRERFYRAEIGRAAGRGVGRLREVKRWLALNDLYYLLTGLLGRRDLRHDWLYARCREVQAAPDGRLDLWAREHGKTSIISFGLTIQDILRDPEITVGIFSHTRPIARAIARPIKREFERNEPLKALFDDVLWAVPTREAPQWSETDGIVVKRRGNPKEATLEAWGLVDGLPTSKHYRLRVYDDVIDKRAVNTPDMIAKATEMWELSLALGTRGGAERYIGTRYHFNDPYAEIIRRGAALPRIHPATADGMADGAPVLFGADELAARRRKMGPFTFAAQMMQNPTADAKQGFQASWLRRYDDAGDGAGMNRYLLVDPASEKKRGSDYTAIAVVGLAADRNYYLLDAVRDRLNLGERADALLALHRRWRPRGVGYEKYGQQCDIEHVLARQAAENYRFEITPLAGALSKADRIKRLVPLFEQGRMYLPDSLIKTDYEGRTIDLMQAFIEEEYKPFPVALHDDLLDALSRILDEALGAVWPKGASTVDEDRYARRRTPRRRGTWMTA